MPVFKVIRPFFMSQKVWSSKQPSLSPVSEPERRAKPPNTPPAGQIASPKKWFAWFVQWFLNGFCQYLR